LASRTSYVCDSFSGLPPGDRNPDADDKNWDNTPHLEVQYGLRDMKVVFAKGLFKDSLASLSNQIKRLVIMRLDRDMYESTVDVLYRLYDKLSVGGYVIMDDWFAFLLGLFADDRRRNLAVHYTLKQYNVYT
jgi:O-methyltransferase